MREIKFRAWINEWRWNLHTRIWEDQQKEDASWMQYFKKNKIEPCNDDCILMQYTWLKDKNWKEIYEGDVVKSVYQRQDWNMYFVECQVSYQVLGLRFDVFNTNDSTKEYNILDRATHELGFRTPITIHWNNSKYEWFFEIIWNIYKNPNLLNKD